MGPSENDQGPSQDAVLKAISGSPPCYLSNPALYFVMFLKSCYSNYDPNRSSLVFIYKVVLILEAEVSKTEGRVGQTTNVVIGGTVTND